MIDEVYDAAMRPGGVERSTVLRDHNFATVGEDKDRPWMYAVHRDDAGKADAYAVYWMKHDWPRSVPAGTITVKGAWAPRRPGTPTSGDSSSTSTWWPPSRRGTARRTSRCSISSASRDACGSR